MMTELLASAKFLPNAFSIGADCLTHGIISCNTLTKSSADEYLLCGWGASSISMQGSPLGSRTVRSSTTLKFLGTKVGEIRARWIAVLMPRRLSRLPFLESIPQISSTDWRDSIAQIRCGLLTVNASTPRNFGHSLLAHWADFSGGLVGAIPHPTVRLAHCMQNVSADHPAKLIIGHGQPHAPAVTEAFIHGIDFKTGNHFFYAGHDAGSHAVIHVEYKNNCRQIPFC
ncbi:hypothetical protein ACCY16_20165 [Candidatus Pantoea formicae]|uniref:hypothetical protein n=1 Tax=Candidatus Pantoea formicae TaxID=2608355 RepID=UPI003ED84646